MRWDEEFVGQMACRASSAGEEGGSRLQFANSIEIEKSRVSRAADGRGCYAPL